jgi:broad specificity phosphatase PhoE
MSKTEAWVEVIKSYYPARTENNESVYKNGEKMKDFISELIHKVQGDEKILVVGHSYFLSLYQDTEREIEGENLKKLNWLENCYMIADINNFPL